MRGVELSLNKGQNRRLERALEQLESLSVKSKSDASVTVSDEIPGFNPEDNNLKGHGTADLDGKLVATLCGVVERVNKLIYVRTLRARYKPETGDIIVGRVIEVSLKRWRIEINHTQDAVLMLSSMNLPDGIQRRRTAMDELNMRSIFEENDVICAEVREIQKDGCVQLQARSQKYGKLKNGQLLTVSPYLVKKSSKHFHYLDKYGVDLIMGRNGFIWVGEHVEVRDDMVEDQIDKPDMKAEDKMSIDEVEEAYAPLDIRQHICRAANAVRALSTLGFMITVELVTKIVELSKFLNLEVHEMLGGEFRVLIAEKEVERRSSSLRRR